MNVQTKTMTTRVHTATFSADEIKGVALSTARKSVDVVEANVLSSVASVAADGSVTVEIVETVPAEAVKALAAPAETPAADVPDAVQAIKPALAAAAPVGIPGFPATGA